MNVNYFIITRKLHYPPYSYHATKYKNNILILETICLLILGKISLSEKEEEKKLFQIAIKCVVFKELPIK